MTLADLVKSRQKELRILLMALVVLILLTGPFWASRGTLRLLIEVFYFLALAQLWNLLAGYTGLISVGQQAFVGLGGYCLFALAIFGGVPVLMAIPIAAIATAIIAWPTAKIAFRLTGPYFAIGTWVIAEVFRLGAAQLSALGGGSGISLPISVVKAISTSRTGREHLMYWIALIIMLIVIFGIWWLMRSRIGLGLAAIRDDDEAARSVGVQTRKLKLRIYIAVAAMTGLIGAMIFIQKLRITPEAAFSVNDWTVLVIFIAVIGGIGTLEGPIVGCILFFIMREYFAELGNWYMIMLGSVSVVVMLIEPKGIWGWIQKRTNLSFFPTARRLD